MLARSPLTAKFSVETERERERKKEREIFNKRQKIEQMIKAQKKIPKPV